MNGRPNGTTTLTAFEQPVSPAAEIPGAAASTRAKLESLTDDRAFEQATMSVLQGIDPTIRHTGGPGDEARDGAGGPWSASSDDILVMVSLERTWKAKIRRELLRIDEFGHSPATVIAVTNRRASARGLRELRRDTSHLPYRVVVLDQEWLANAFLRQEHLDLRASFLGLAPPTFPSLTTTSAQLDSMSDALGGTLAPFTGRRRAVERAVQDLAEGRSLLLEGPGGVGKTRLALEISQRCGPNRVSVLRANTRVDFSRLPSEVVGDGTLILVVDDAHRRSDLAAVVDSVTRRRGPTRLILTARPGYRQEIYAAIGDSGTSLVEHRVQKLSNKAIARLVDRAEPALKYERATDAIVRVAHGNPFIALVAHRVVVSGGTIRDLGADGALLAHLQELLATIARASTANAKQLYEAAALVSAAGRVVTADDAALEALSGLLGIAPNDFLHWLNDLADGGLLTGNGDPAFPFAFSADVLAEVLMRDAFLGVHPRSSQRYRDVWPTVAALNAESSAAAIAGATARAIDTADPAFQVVREWCHERVAGQPNLVLKVVREAAPGVPSLAEEMVRNVLSRGPDGNPVTIDTLRSAAELLAQRHPRFDTSWELLLEVARRIFASDPSAEVAKATREAVSGVYRRLPIGTGPSDGVVLAEVQRAMVTISNRVWQKHRSGTTVSQGAPEVVASAALTLLTLSFDDTYSTPDERTIVTSRRTLPASVLTKAALDAGADLIVDVLPHLSAASAAATIRALGPLARGAQGLAVRIEPLPPDLVRLASAALERISNGVDRSEQQLTIPLRHLVNDTFGTTVFASSDVAEFASVFAFDHGRYRRDPDAKVEKMRTTIGAHLLSGFSAETVDRWEAWIRDADAAGIDLAHHQVSELLERAAEMDAPTISPMVDDLGARSSPLLKNAIGALARVIETVGGPERVRRWEGMEAGARTVLAFALARLGDERWKETMMRLAVDTDSQVRSGAARVLNLARDPKWAQEVALAACSDCDISRLYYLLLAFDVRPEHSAEADIEPGLVSDVVDLVVASARKFPAVERHVGSVLQMTEELAPGSTMRWVWARVEAALEPGGSYPTQERWDFPYGLLEDFAFEASDADRRRALALLDDEPTMGSAFASDILKAIDRGDPAVTSWIVERIDSGQESDWRITRSLLDNPMPWSAYRERVRAMMPKAPSGDTLAGIVYAREPTSWVNSRRPGVEATLAEFRRWDEPIFEPVRTTAERILGESLARIDREENAKDHDDDEDPDPAEGSFPN